MPTGAHLYAAMMTSVYDLAPLQVWHDEEAESLIFEWFGIAPIGLALRELFDMALELGRTERRRAAASGRTLSWIFDLRHLLIRNPADVRWIALNWAPRLTAVGVDTPVFVLPDGPLREALSTAMTRPPAWSRPPGAADAVGGAVTFCADLDTARSQLGGNNIGQGAGWLQAA